MIDLMKCNECGEQFNIGDLSEVAMHEHSEIVIEQNIGKKIIKHASDVYPHCNGQFAGGVHSFLRGDKIDQLESAKFRQGYYRASFDLEDRFILKHG